MILPHCITCSITFSCTIPTDIVTQYTYLVPSLRSLFLWVLRFSFLYSQPLQALVLLSCLSGLCHNCNLSFRPVWTTFHSYCNGYPQVCTTKLLFCTSVLFHYSLPPSVVQTWGYPLQYEWNIVIKIFNTAHTGRSIITASSCFIIKMSHSVEYMELYGSFI